LAAWQAGFLDTVTRAVNPFGIALGQQPLSSHDGKAIERKAHGLAHTHEPVNRSHFGQHMGRVRSLALAFASASPVL
jgi:hypothetical protein